MSFFDKLLAPFRKKNVSEPVVEDTPELSPLAIQEKSDVFIQEKQSSIPHWLADENQLRDEGVLYGLAGTNPDEKITVIRSHFVQETAELEKDKEQFAEKIQELNLFIEQKETRIEELKAKANALESQVPDTNTQLLRTGVGLLLSLAMCGGNYFLIQEVFVSSFQKSEPVAIGVFLAGMFNLFSRTSIFHAHQRPTWQQLVEEIGMPLAAAFFVFVVASQNRTSLMATAIFVFVFFLFLFAGKLLLSNLTLLRNDLMVYTANRQLKYDKKHKKAEWEQEIEQLKANIDDFRVQKWQILPDLNRTEAELTRLYAHRDTLIKLFESEYNLARSYKMRGLVMPQV